VVSSNNSLDFSTARSGFHAEETSAVWVQKIKKWGGKIGKGEALSRKEKGAVYGQYHR